jgi:hypothetical protein
MYVRLEFEGGDVVRIEDGYRVINLFIEGEKTREGYEFYCKSSGQYALAYLDGWKISVMPIKITLWIELGRKVNNWVDLQMIVKVISGMYKIMTDRKKKCVAMRRLNNKGEEENDDVIRVSALGMKAELKEIYIAFT